MRYSTSFILNNSLPEKVIFEYVARLLFHLADGGAETGAETTAKPDAKPAPGGRRNGKLGAEALFHPGPMLALSLMVIVYRQLCGTQ